MTPENTTPANIVPRVNILGREPFQHIADSHGWKIIDLGDYKHPDPINEVAKKLTAIQGQLDRLIQARELDRSERGSRGAGNECIGREEVAELLGCHPDSLSRMRKELGAEGLIGIRIEGCRSLRWRREDVLAYMAHKGLSGKRKPGRPRKNF